MGANTTRFVYDINGTLVTEDDGISTRDDVYVNGRLVAVLDSEGAGVTVRYVHTDHLGTTQRMSNAAGVVVWSADYAPYGEAIVDEDPDGNGQTRYRSMCAFRGSILMRKVGCISTITGTVTLRLDVT